MPLKITGLFEIQLVAQSNSTIILLTNYRQSVSLIIGKEETAVDLLDIFKEAVGVFKAYKPWDNRSDGADEEEE